MQIAVLKDCNELENCKASFELITFEIAPAIASVKIFAAVKMFKNGPTRPLFVFKHKFFRKNCRHQRDRNSDCQSRRRTR